MSWSAPECPTCHHSSNDGSVRFEGPDPYGPPFTFAVAWVCEPCKVRMLELVPIIAAPPRPGWCLNCGEAELERGGRCPACEVHHGQLLARIRRLCGRTTALERVPKLCERGLFRVALNLIDLRLQRKPDDAEALAAKGSLLIDVHRPAPAVPHLRRALELGAGPNTLVQLGIALANSGEPREAIAVYERFLAQYPTDYGRGVVLSNIGGCYSALGQRRQGEAYHRRAIAVDPPNLAPRWNLFANLLAQRRVADALEVLDQTITLPMLETAEVENLHAYRSDLLARLGRLDEALTAIDASLKGDPGQPELLFVRARLLLRLARFDEAKLTLLRSLERRPQFEAAAALLAKIHGARAAAPN